MTPRSTLRTLLLGSLTSLTACAPPIEDATAALRSADDPKLAAETLAVPSAQLQRFASDETWFSSAGGTAMPVCLRSSTPAACPQTGSVLLYNYPGSGWAASLSPIPQAKWVWDASDVASPTPAEGDEIVVSKLLQLPQCRQGVQGWIFIAADDYAEVFVNGVLAGTIGSTTDPVEASKAQNGLSFFNLSSLLGAGALNDITVRAVNGQCPGCNYSSNPAGVVFGGALGCS